MPTAPSKFALEEEISVVGNRVRVSGILQLEDSEGRTITRYLLAGSSGTTQILEDRGNAFLLLRPFPPVSQPQVDGKSVTVLGDKYTLTDVTKLKVVGVEGQSPCNAIAPQLVVSGRFCGDYGELLREIATGSNAQTFYSLKPVALDDVRNAAQMAAIEAAEAQMREQAALEEREDEPAGGWKTKIVGWVIVVLIFVFLSYACSDGDDVSSSGSARSSSHYSGGGFHGK